MVQFSMSVCGFDNESYYVVSDYIIESFGFVSLKDFYDVSISGFN